MNDEPRATADGDGDDLRGVRQGEGLRTLLAALAFFFILTSYYIIRPVRDQLSGAVGSSSLPLFYAGTFVAMLALTPVFGALVSRFSRRWLIAVCYSFFILCLLAFVPAFLAQAQIGARTLGIVFFTWTSVFNLFVVALFWSLMADLFSDAQARRIFPLIGVGGTLGALAGPALTTTLVGVLGVAPLLVVSAITLTAATVIALWLSWRSGAGREPAPAIGGSILAGVRQVFTQPFVRMMALLMLLSDGVGTVAYALLADYSKGHFASAVARTAFYGRIDWATNILVILLQIGFTRWMLTRHGPGWCLALAEAANVALFLLLAAFALHAVPLPWLDWSSGSLVAVAVPVIALVTIGSRGLAYGIIVPASNTLYTRATRETRYKGKNFVDTAVWRFGDVVVTSSLTGLRAIGASISVLSLISACAAGLAGVVGWRAAHAVGAGGRNRSGSGTRDSEPGTRDRGSGDRGPGTRDP
ncbi:MAG TPA: MFS transporter [Rhodanobacteraceae bacterium]|nr:MFS transporter [Rhodanobacteraceae bacterium]